MRNPGLKNHTPDEPFLRVISRTTVNQIMRQPQTYNGDGASDVVPPEPATLKENVMQGPPSASSNTPGPNATNGAPPILRLNDVASTPGMDPNPGANQRRIDTQKGDGSKENPAYDRAQQAIQNKMQRRRAHPLHQGSAPDGWESPGENEDAAFVPGSGINTFGPVCETCWLQDGVKNIFPEGHERSPEDYGHSFKPMVMEPGQRFSAFLRETGQRYAAPRNPGMKLLAAFDTNPAYLRGELWPSGGSEADNITNFKDRDPAFRVPEWRDETIYTDQPMIDFKKEYATDRNGNPLLDEPFIHSPTEGCETCWIQKGHLPPHSKIRHDKGYVPDHEYKPFPPQARLAAQVPSDDPIYPYHPQEHPELDTTDLENLQSGDDTYSTSPHQAPNLMDRVFGPSTGEETPEHERAADAHERFFRDLLPGMPAAHREMRAEDLPSDLVDRTDAEDVAGGFNTMMNKVLGDENIAPPGGGLTQAQKGHIHDYVEGLQENHKQKVKRLQDEWRARGGRKTGEPMPVARFDPRLTHKGGQQIVPMEGNPFPELEHPIYYVGKCEGCGQTLFDGADVSGDPRGALGEHTRGHLNAADYDVSAQSGRPEGDDRRLHGPSPLICPNCYDSQERHNRILDKYLGHKAGDQTGGYHWTWQRQPDGTKKNVLVNHTYKDDREGIWHAPGEQVGNCPQCDAGETGFYHTAMMWSNILREEQE